MESRSSQIILIRDVVNEPTLIHFSDDFHFSQASKDILFLFITGDEAMMITQLPWIAGWNSAQSRALPQMLDLPKREDVYIMQTVLKLRLLYACPRLQPRWHQGGWSEIHYGFVQIILANISNKGRVHLSCLQIQISYFLINGGLLLFVRCTYNRRKFIVKNFCITHILLTDVQQYNK